jgi:hypothetical protein
MIELRCGLRVLQRNVRRYLVFKSWAWFRLFVNLKPLLLVVRKDKEACRLKENLERLMLERDDLKGRLVKEKMVLGELGMGRKKLETEVIKANECFKELDAKFKRYVK